jgi:ABC-type antimicrobial peptide transport system permease subunit
MLEIPVKEGRNFSDLYGTDKTNAVIVNEAFVKAAGLNNPIGTPIQIKDWFPKDATIIGVVKDYHLGSLKEIIQPEILTITDESQGTMLIKIDKQRQKQALAALEKVYKTAVPGAEYSYVFWDELNAKEYHLERKWQQIINAATLLSVLICCLGLFGLTHLATHMRVKEIGIRKVLGATVSSIASLISRDFIKLVLIAVVVASPVAWYFMNQWLQDFAYRINISWWVFVLAGVAAVFIALLTIIFQAIKAAVANPVKSLRTE